MVDSSQAVKDSYSYEAFGQATVGQSDVANPYLFVGGYGVQWESTPSLYFMQARYYGPGSGRFLSEDPYGGSPQDPLSLHRYLYCANGPVSSTDASGWQFDPRSEANYFVSVGLVFEPWFRFGGLYVCMDLCYIIGFPLRPLSDEGICAQLRHHFVGITWTTSWNWAGIAQRVKQIVRSLPGVVNACSAALCLDSCWQAWIEHEGRLTEFTRWHLY